MGVFRRPYMAEVELLRLIATEGGSMDHDDKRLAPFCSDESTLTHPDIFNSAHDMGWLESTHDNRTDASRVRITDAGCEIVGWDRDAQIDERTGNIIK